MATRLSPEEIESFCLQNGWETDGPTAIAKQFTFETYQQALQFVNTVATRAEERQHHPDMLLSYGKVRIVLSTHDAGGVTELDTGLARHIDSVA